MRKLVLTGLMMIIYATSWGQYLTDAIRVFDNFYKGTARTAAMGDAFSSLGGDIGSIPINPAAFGVYQSGEFAFSSGLLSFNNNSKYYGTSINETQYKFNFPSIGLVLSNKLDASGEWKNVNLFFGFNKVNNLNNIFTIRGNTSNTSMMDEFVSYANQNPHSLDSYFEQLAFDAYLIDTVAGDNSHYYSPYSGIPLSQRRSMETSGSIGEYSFGLAGNYNHKLYVGLTINLRSGYYEDTYHHTEEDVNNAITDSYYTFNYQLMSWVSGWNAKLGLIYRPVEYVRLGLSIHTPSVLRIRQEMYTSVSAVEDDGKVWNYRPTDSKGYALGNFVDHYTITTPFRAVVGVSYLFGELGLLSVDYERADYSLIKVTSADDVGAKDASNELIKSALKTTNSIRAGGELRLNSLYLRGGFAYYQSPFASAEINKNADTYAYSGGIGYRTGKFSLDFAYTLTQKSEYYFLYNSTNVYPARLNTGISSYLISMGFRF